MVILLFSSPLYTVMPNNLPYDFETEAAPVRDGALNSNSVSIRVAPQARNRAPSVLPKLPPGQEAPA